VIGLAVSGQFLMAANTSGAAVPWPAGLGENHGGGVLVVAEPLAEHVRAYTRQSPHALAYLHRNLAIAFTYDDALRRARSLPPHAARNGRPVAGPLVPSGSRVPPAGRRADAWRRNLALRRTGTEVAG